MINGSVKQTVNLFRKWAEACTRDGLTERAEVYNAIARMFDNIGTDITTELAEADTDEKRVAWENAVNLLDL